MRTSNCNARQYVESKQEFQGNNTFGIKRNGVYAVFSYGSHFPMYVYKSGRWYRNTDKYSVSTSRHQSQICPLGVKFVERDTEQLKRLIKIDGKTFASWLHLS